MDWVGGGVVWCTLWHAQDMSMAWSLRCESGPHTRVCIGHASKEATLPIRGAHPPRTRVKVECVGGEWVGEVGVVMACGGKDKKQRSKNLLNGSRERASNRHQIS